jgi:hypothetical protein
MQPFDRDNAQARREAATMVAATLRQRAESGEQRTRMRALPEADEGVRRRACLGGRPEGPRSAPEPLTFVRAGGATARVGGRDARAISDALWDLGLLAGAATAVATIADAMKTRPALRRPVQLTEREDEALLCAGDSRVTWSLG